MKTQLQRSEVLYNISRMLHQLNLNLPKIAQTVVSMTGQAIGVQHGCLMTFRDEYSVDQAYSLDTERNPDPEMALWNLLLTRGLVGFVRHGQRTVIIRNIQTDPRWPHLPKAPYIPEAGSAIGLPLMHGRHVYGVLIFIHSEIDFFSTEIVNLLEEIASLASASIDNALDLLAARNGSDNGHYQVLFDDAIMPIMLTDMNGFIFDINDKAAEFLGRPREALLHLPITAIHPVDQKSLNQQIKSLDYGEETIFQTALRNEETGEEIPVMVSARHILLGQEHVIEWTAQDITAHMELEQLRRDLSAMVYHDLRGPLQAVKGSISKLGQVLANHENPAVWTLLQVGIRSTRQLQRMVDSLVDIQRLEAGKAILNLKPVELRVLLADSAQLVQPLAAEMNHQLRFELQDNLPLVLMDGDMMMRVVINLMENAIKYTPDGGSISLSARIENEQIRVSVRDTGPGIPSEMKRQVFDKFSRVKYRDAPKGVGLGLAFCRLAVEAHGGHIWVESEQGNGSEFIFVMPLKLVEEEEDKVSESALATA